MGAGFLIAVGTLLNISQLFVMAAALSSLLGISYILARLSARQLVIHFQAPNIAAVRQPFEARVAIGGGGVVSEARFDVMLTLPLEVDITEMPQGEQQGASEAIRFGLTATARGLHAVGPATIKLHDPLGLISVRVESREPIEVAAWPEPVDPNMLVETAERPSAGGYYEVGRRAVEGSSVYGVRQWAPGDAPRHVHWPSTARLGKLAVMEFEAEASEDVLVVLDVRAIVSQPASDAAFETACGVTSFLLTHGWASKRRVRLVVDGHSIDNLTRAAGELYKLQVLKALAVAERVSVTPLARVFERAFPQLQPREAILVTTLWDQEAQQAVAGFGRSCPISVLSVRPGGGGTQIGERVGPPETPEGGFVVYTLTANESSGA